MEKDEVAERIRIARECGNPEVARIDAKWKDFDTTAICKQINGQWSFDGFITSMIYQNELQRAVDPSIGPLPPHCFDRIQISQFLRLKTGLPMWNGKDELWFNNRIVKRFKKPAPTQKALLSEFEAQGWLPEIRNPWREAGLAIDVANEALRNAVDGLKDNQLEAKVIFTCRAAFDFVSWKFVENR